MCTVRLRHQASYDTLPIQLWIRATVPRPGVLAGNIRTEGKLHGMHHRLAVGDLCVYRRFDKSHRHSIAQLENECPSRASGYGAISRKHQRGHPDDWQLPVRRRCSTANLKTAAQGVLQEARPEI